MKRHVMLTIMLAVIPVLIIAQSGVFKEIVNILKSTWKEGGFTLLEERTIDLNQTRVLQSTSMTFRANKKYVAVVILDNCKYCDPSIFLEVGYESFELEPQVIREGDVSAFYSIIYESTSFDGQIVARTGTYIWHTACLLVFGE